MSLTNRVLYDGLFTFGMRIVNIVCAMGVGILTARVLGPTGKGLYALPSVEAGLIVSGFAGLSSALTYFLLHHKTGPGILRPALIAGALFVIAGAVAIVPLAFFSGQHWAALPAILSLPAGAATCLATGYAIGVKRVRYATALGTAVTVGTLALMLCGFFLISRTPGVAIVAWIAGNAVIAVVAVAAMAIHARKLEGDDVPTLGRFTKFSIKVGLVQLVSLLNYRADLYLVAIMTTPAALGVYTVAVSAAESLLLPTQVAALVTSPHIGSFEREPAAALAARCVRNNLLVALVVCAAIFVCCPPIVKLLYGPAFMPVVPALRILLAGVFALSLASPISSYFTLKLGRPEVPLLLAAGAAVICIAVTVALLPRLGIIGAATGSTVAYIVGQIAGIWYFASQTKISLRTILLPTKEDLQVYAAFGSRVFQDGHRLLRREALVRRG